MQIVSSYIEIGQWKFDHSVGIEIISEIDSLTDTCKITIPRKYNWVGKDIAMGDEPYIRRKDKVLVKLGYDGILKTQFVGYVKSVKAGVPVTIECEDSMFMLKQKPIEKLSLPAGLTLEKWLDIILPAGIEKVCTPVVLGSLRVTNQTPAEIMDWVKTNYGFRFYFRLKMVGDEVKPVLYAGLPYSQLLDDRRTAKFQFGKTIIDPYGLEYRRAEDVRLKVKAVGVLPNNKKIEVQVGDADGELRTVHYYNVTLEALKARAEEDLQRFKYTGYRGSFQTFGEPSVRKGDIAFITGNAYNPDGKYLIGKVSKSVSVGGGYKQTIEPNSIVND